MRSEELEDDRLRLVFTCCHPALAPDAQVALTLREVCGLATEEIAAAFLTPAPTIAQRIVRAKTKIRDANIPYQVPARDELPARLDSVLRVVYLVFNEGYSASSGESATRADLSGEAIRLGRLIVELHPEPEAQGLLALMLLHESRRETRATPDGELILLDEQDRSRWNRALIAEGAALVRTALSTQRIGPYSVQAAIAAVHAEAASAADTDWREIVGLYDLLLRITPSPIVALNRTVAIAMRDGPEAGPRATRPVLARGRARRLPARVRGARRLLPPPGAAPGARAPTSAPSSSRRRVRHGASWNGGSRPCRLRPESSADSMVYALAHISCAALSKTPRPFDQLSTEGDPRVKYLCLVYLSPEEWNSAPDEACMACGDELRASGHFITGTPLHPTHTATTVRVRNGQLTVTDGPFAETKEQLAGFYLIDARDLNEAIQLASKIPPAKFGSIEVRPTRELVVSRNTPRRPPRPEPLNPRNVHALADLRQSPGQGPEALRGFLHEARLHVQPHVHRRKRDLHDPRRQPVRDAAGREVLRTFTSKTIADTARSTEVLNCVACSSREQVDSLVAKARAGGAKVPREPQDHGFMYAHGYEDLDGHTWELIHMAGEPPKQ